RGTDLWPRQGSSNSLALFNQPDCKERKGQTSDPRSCISAPLAHASQINLTYQERWFLDFFRRVTSHTNATYFNKAFWGMLVHQASEIQPAVRHAAIGIGSLHWGGMMKTAAAGQITSFSLRQCSKSLEHLRQNLTADIGRRPRMETVLVSCGILLAFAFSQGDAKAGGCHLRAGYELLQKWQKVKMDKSPFLPNSLGLAVPLDLEPGSKSYSYPLQLAAEYQLDVLIETPEEACGSLLILGWLALQMKPQLSTGTFAESTPSAVLKRLQNWKHLILQRGQSQARRDTIAILDIWSEVLLIKSLTDGRLWECEMRYDDYSSHFLRTIQQGKRFMAQRSLQDSWVRSGVVAPLFFCAFKCRDWVIRREALHLLSGCGSEQGIWSISKPSLVLDRLIKIETRDCQSWETIPESARIDAVRVEFLSGETKFALTGRASPAHLCTE
ncbi:hypothetical protein N7509_004506, partial [Penicillium cosmopolitanum]